MVQLARIFERRDLAAPRLIRIAEDPIGYRQIGESIEFGIMDVVDGRRPMPARVINAQDRLKGGACCFELRFRIDLRTGILSLMVPGS